MHSPMRPAPMHAGWGIAALLALSAPSFAQAPAAAPADPTAGSTNPIDRVQVDKWVQDPANWGRWGKDDELGALNLITPAKQAQAMALAKKGIVVSMEFPIRIVPKMAAVAADGLPNGIAYYELRARTFPPGDQYGNAGYTSDVQEYAVHGGNTHLDALCHMSDGNGRLYNGYPLAESIKEREGCTKLGLDKIKAGIVTRGILVDMTRLKGSTHQPGTAIFAKDIEAWEKQAKVTVGPGDALFVYDPGPMVDGRRRNGGFDITVGPWMNKRGVAVTSGFSRNPPVRNELRADHRLTLAGYGIFLLDGPDLAELAETAAKENRWEFMLVVAPPRAPGSSGALVNPLAMF